MDNTINNLSFKANITTLTKIRNKSAYAEANNLFKKGTKNNKDILLITSTPYGESQLQISQVKNGEYIDSGIGNITIHDINKQLETNGTKEFAQKLINAYNALISHKETSQLVNSLNAEILRAKALYITNTRIAKACASNGKAHLAKRYDVLANRNKEKIVALTKEMNLHKKQFNEIIENLSTKCKELVQLRFNI